MKKRLIFIGTLATITVLGISWSKGGADPVMKDNYSPISKDTTYRGQVAWPLETRDRSIAGEASGVAVAPNGDVYYLHRGSNSYGDDTYITEPTLIVLDGKTMHVKKRLGAGLFKSPHGLEVDDQNNIWITDISLNQVFKLDPSGKVLQTFGNAYGPFTEVGLRIRNVLPSIPLQLDEKTFARPTDVTVFKDGSFAVSDGYRNSRIVMFDPKGAVKWEVNELGKQDGQFNLPHGISSDDKMNLYVADRDNARVQVFDRNGKHIDTWSSKELGRPYGIEVGTNGKVYVADGGNYLNGQKKNAQSQIVILNKQGKIEKRFGAWGKEAGQLRIAHDIAVSSDGTIYVAELLNKRLQLFSKN
ncbi:peptidylamidoglycolate lyase [Exiguobacterium indicum]|uniref:Peptidylamidoglycolate lyase n=1 Tax=Exiguobacterium indicum TaxID=296995 RepID=A0A0V8GBY1_9BACL|nr:peptidyl-alpha-hydroxyglycine alpha-amidating lyase family protein [Exiguobacterium enclense]KSU47805.1 peptidylamidoglycolate lyase [Exiguobacterium enclense]SDD26730.1 Sugar lactone lactonase YvrE [Exiguobacterium enclense]